MKNVFCIIVLTLTVNVSISQASFGISAGYATNGIGGQASYNHELNGNGYFQINIIGSDSKSVEQQLEIPYRTIGLNIGYYHYIFKNRNQNFLISLGAGGALGYEIINNGDTILDNGEIIKGNSEIVYGAFAGSEIQYYLSDQLALLGVVNTYLYINSDLGLSSIYTGLGIRFYVN